MYTNLAYQHALKAERKKRGLTTKEMAAISGMSVGAINAIENSPDVRMHKKVGLILEHLNLSNDYFSVMETTIGNHINNLIEQLVWVQKDLAATTYQTIQEYKKSYQNDVLSLIFDLATFVYEVTNGPVKPSLTNLMNKLSKHQDYFTDDTLGIFETYCGSHLIHLNQYNLAKNHLETALSLLNNTHPCYAMSFYFMATCQMHRGDIIDSIRYCESASLEFTKTNNMRRILNINLVRMLQYLKIKNYHAAIEIGLKNYPIALENHYDSLANRIIYNIGYTYMIKQQPSLATEYFIKIPMISRTVKHSVLLMVAYALNNQMDEAKAIYNEARLKDINGEYLEFLDAYEAYFATSDLVTFDDSFSALYKRIKKDVNNFSKEFYLLVLIDAEKKLHRYKQALTHLEEFTQLIY